MNGLQNNYEKLSEDFDQESKKSAKLLKNLNKFGRKRIVIALVRCSQSTRRVYWNRWLGAISLRDQKLSFVQRLVRLWDKNCEKKAWRAWILHIKKKYEA